MRISQKHSFLFIHIPKTAGTSIANMLDPYCEKRPEATLFRRALTNLPIRENHAKAFFRPHYTARWTRIKIGKSNFDQLFSFAFVRNPFDLMVSRYLFIKNAHWHHRSKAMSEASFSEFVKWEASRHRYIRRDQLSFIADLGGNIIVDEIYRFESIATEVDRMCSQIGIAPTEKLSWEKKQVRKPYQEYYTDQDKDTITKLFERDLNAFGYSF